MKHIEELFRKHFPDDAEEIIKKRLRRFVVWRVRSVIKREWRTILVILVIVLGSIYARCQVAQIRVEQDGVQSGNPAAGVIRFNCIGPGVTCSWNAVTRKFEISAAGGPGGGVTTWNGLSGAVTYTPAWIDITGKPLSFTPSAHTHLKVDITDFPVTWDWTAITTKPTNFQADWNTTVINKPATYAPTAHALLSASHSDTTAAAPVRGDMIAAVGATPTWQRVAHPSIVGGGWIWNGTDVVATTTPDALLLVKGTSTLTTTAISSGACATTVTTAATNALTTDVVEWSYASFASPSTDGRLIVNAWTTAGNVNFSRCNPTAASITPTALVINWRIDR